MIREYGMGFDISRNTNLRLSFARMAVYGLSLSFCRQALEARPIMMDPMRVGVNQISQLGLKLILVTRNAVSVAI